MSTYPGQLGQPAPALTPLVIASRLAAQLQADAQALEDDELAALEALADELAEVVGLDDADELAAATWWAW